LPQAAPAASGVKRRPSVDAGDRMGPGGGRSREIPDVGTIYAGSGLASD